MAELHNQGAVSADGYDPAADIGSETDASPRPVDENGQESWAEDAEPLTRDEYAEQARQNEATTVHDRDHDSDDSHEPAVTDDGQDQEELPEPRTRQEVADEASRAGTDAPDRGQAADAAIDAGTAEDGNLPEPRTRQEVADEARSDADPLAHVSSDAQQHERDTQDWPSPEERARLHETYLDWRNEITTAGREQGTNIIGEKSERSPSDRSDLPPIGEELLHMDSDAESWKGKFRNEIHEQVDEITDVAEKWGDLGAQLFERPPTSTHSEVPTVQPDLPQHAYHGIEGGQVAIASFAVGLLAFEGFRRLRDKVNARRSRS